MEAVLVFIDGTICDTRHRNHLFGKPEFYNREAILKDEVVPGSVDCINELAERYTIVYMGARPESTLSITREWIDNMGFPKGSLYLTPTHKKRKVLAMSLCNKIDFIAGIGDRWDDNEMHLEMGCLSIILKEYDCNWDTVRKHLLEKHID